MTRLFFKLLGSGLAMALALGVAKPAYAQCPTVVSLSHTDVSCFGSNDGTITVTLSTDVDNFELFDNFLGSFVTISVIENQTPNSVTYTNVYPSSFQVVAFKAGCLALQISDGPGGIEITEPAQLAVTVDAIDPDCDTSIGSGTGSINITVSGGTAPYSFVWSDGATSEDRTTLDAGNYHVDVTDANGCAIGTDAVVPVITQAAAGPDQNICTDNTTMAANSPGVGEIGTWSMVTPQGTIAIQNPNSPTTVIGNIPEGVHVFRWTITDIDGTCAGTFSDVTITRFQSASVDAGAPITICAGATVPLSGTIGGSATSATWSSPTGGTFNNPSSLNAIYTPSATDIANGSVVLTLTTNDPLGPCGPQSDNVTITINSPATVSAGPDLTICAGETATMAGAFGGAATGVTWSTSSPTGTFDVITNPNAVYTPSPEDIAAGSVILTITTDDPAGPCPAVSDFMVLTINPLPTVDAGPDEAICSSENTVTLAGTIGGGATSATWSSSGTGSFDNPSSLNATYSPSEADKAAGTITLTLTTNDPAGPCVAASDEVIITIEPEATVEAGSPITVCEGDPVPVSGTIGGSATSATWSSSGTGLFDDATSLNAIYTPSAGDIAAGTVTLTLTTNDPAGVCGPVSDDVVITINPLPEVDAGAPQSICAGSSVTLAGSIGGAATSATWSSSGTGLFDNATSLNAVYTPSEDDIAAGTVTLTLTTNDPAGPCGSVSDDVVITIEPIATVEAGDPIITCDADPVQLNGSIGGSATSAIWSSSGTGLFDDATSLDAIYTPSAGDIAAGTVTLTLTTNDPAGACPSVSDNVVLTINPLATVDAGAPVTICSGESVTLSGVIGGSATSAVWSSSGDGTFNNENLLNAEYEPGNLDRSSGTVTLTLTTNDPAGPCVAVSDVVVITIDPAPTVDAGSPQTICAGDDVTLSGTIGGSATTATWSTISGDGNFDDANSLTATYTPGPGDILAGSVSFVLTTGATASCDPVSDTVVVTITPPPTTANAGPDKTVCGPTTLEGNAPAMGTGTWTIVSGTGGILDDPNDPNSGFTGNSGEVYVLEWTIATCTASSDQVQITFDPDSPTVANAGGDQTICSTVSTTATLLANTPTVGTGMWSIISGDGGSFADATSPGTLFTGMAGETYVLRWTITATCASTSDDVTITFEPGPSTADAGSDIQACGTSATLAAVAPGIGTGQWSVVTGAGGSFADASDPQTEFTGVAGATYTLRWTVTNSCGSTTDDIVVTLESPPTAADAGPDKTVCGTTNLEGNVPGIGTGTWTITSGAGGNVVDPSDPTSEFTGVGGTTYTLVWTITNGTCTPSTDEVVITFDPDSPTPSDAGPDQTVCGASTTLAGVNPTIGTGQWSVVTGDGAESFDDVNDPAATFSGTAGETYVLRWTITSSCGTSEDDVTIVFEEAPTTADAGSDLLNSCGPVNLPGNTPVVGTGTWTIVSGTGGVISNPSDPNSVFQGLPGASYTLQWTITNGSCPPSSDQVEISFDLNTPTIADAGPDQNVCGTSTTLAANTPDIGVGQWSIVFGAGGSLDDPSDPNTTFNGVAGTTYQLLWTISNGVTCTPSNDDVVITFDAPPTVADAGGDQQICGNATTLTANTPAVGTGQWSVVSGAGGSFADASDPSSGFTGVQGTSYILRWTITNACGSSEDEVQITFDQVPTVADAGPDQTACGPATLAGNTPGVGAGQWTIVSGVGGILADASNPSSQFSGVGGTTYTLRWTISNGSCAASSDEVDITFDLNTPTIADAGPDQNVCGTSATLAANTPVVGTGEWSVVSGDGAGSFADDSDPATTFTGTAGTTYVLRWTISNGVACAPSTDDVTIAFEQMPAGTNAGPDQQVCGTSATLAGNTPASGAGLWTVVSGTGGSFDDATNPAAIFTGNAGETYVLRWTVTNSCGSESDEVSVTLDETPPAADAGPDQIICGSTFTTLAANAPGAGNTGLWIIVNGNGGGVLTPTSPTSQFTGVAGTSYTLRWVITNGGTCQPSTDDVVINFASAPAATSPVNACINSAAPTLQATATGATSINWYADAGLTTLVFTGTNYTPAPAQLNMNVLGSTTFYVTATYPCGESAATPVTVNVVDGPGCGGGGTNCFAFTILVVDAETQRPSCADQDDGVITLDVSGVVGGTYIVQLISPTDTLTQVGPAGVFKFSNLTAASYSYRVEDGAGNVCQQPYNLPLRTLVEATASDPVDALCYGDPSGAVTMTITGGNSPYEYSLDGVSWFDGLISGGQITGLPANGTYPILIRDDASDLCPAEVMVTINSVHPQIQATFNVTPATCNGADGSIAVASVSGGSGSGYQFALNGGTFGDGPFTELSGGNYTVTVRDDAGCTRDFTVSVTFPGFINHTIAAANATCDNEGMSGTITLEITDPGTFQVALSTDQFNEPADELYQTYQAPSVTFDELSRGTYYVYMRATSSSCPTRSAPISILGAYAIDFDIEPVCNLNELSIALTNIVGDPTQAFQIVVYPRFSSTPVEIISAGLIAPTRSYLLPYASHPWLQSPDEYQIQIIQVQDVGGPLCEIKSPLVPFTVPVPLFAAIGATEESYPDIMTGSLQITNFSGPGPDYTTYIELDSAAVPGQVFMSGPDIVPTNPVGIFEIIYENIPAGRYEVVVQDKNGCTKTLVARVPLDTDIYIPNIFTPNGDNKNDFFYIRNLPAEGASLIINNRWGTQVYSSNSYQNDWDGGEVPDGVYFYRLKVPDGAAITGWVEILRGVKP